jgi:predicted nucleic acid-binding protein
VRLVLDTNLLVSGVIAAGLPRRLVDGAKAGEFELCTSEVLLAELLDVLSREKFAARLSQAGLIASGDKRDLLPMGSFLGIPSITAQEARPDPGAAGPRRRRKRQDLTPAPPDPGAAAGETEVPVEIRGRVRIRLPYIRSD